MPKLTIAHLYWSARVMVPMAIYIGVYFWVKS